MRAHYLSLLLYLSLSVLPVFSQEQVEVGIPVGNFVLRPEVRGLAAYDSRVRLNEATDEAEGDYYGEFAVGASIENLPALYSVGANALYGRRYYVDYTDRDDDFYNAGASIGSSGEAVGLRWGLSAVADKALSYDIEYNPETGEGPGSILSDQQNKGWTGQGHIGYEIPLSDRTFFIPEYTGMHYYREFEADDTARWQEHDVNLLLNYILSERVTLLVGGGYTLQVNDDEDGYIATLGGGARGELSERTSWSALVGVAHVDYELSGADEGALADLNARWQATEKVDLYVFYSNRYEPGYGGGRARMLYRAGYGASWAFASRWLWEGQILHDYTEEVGSGVSGDDYGGVNHFFTTQVEYRTTARFSSFLRFLYANDEYADDQHVVSLGVSYIH